MIVEGVGVDIEDIDRFRKFKYAEEPFLQRIFTARELEYCFLKGDPAASLAVRYAAKEAVVKSLSRVVEEEIDYRMIEISINEKHAPTVTLGAELANLYIQLSLAHDKDKAIAFVLVTRDDS